MLKCKPWLNNIIRIPNPKVKRHNSIRLDRSERVVRFSEEFFNTFIKSITQEDIMAYPETDALINRLCEYHRVSEDNIFLAPGADAGIKSFFEIAVSPGDEVIITEPSFPMYSVYTNLFNAKVVKVPYISRTNLDFNMLIDSINQNTNLLTIANPNSPIGDYIETDNIEEVVKKSAIYNIPVLIDEAYCEYSPGTAIKLIDKYENIGILRTFSKVFGGAGIRVGYVIGNKELIGKLYKFRLMYEVNQIGVKFAVYALDHMDIALEYAEDIKKERSIIVKRLLDSGYDVIPSHTNWIHFHGGVLNIKVIEVFNKHKVLFKTDSRIPYDNKKDWIRLNIGPGLSNTPYMLDIINKNFI